jgi:hypothetical protein
MMSRYLKQTVLLRPQIPLHSRETDESRISAQHTTVRLLFHLMRTDAAKASVISDSRGKEMDFRSPKVVSATTEGM